MSSSIVCSDYNYKYQYIFLSHYLVISTDAMPRDASGSIISSTSLSDLFFDPMIIDSEFIGNAINGMTTMPAQLLDTKFVTSIRNFLFTKVGTNPTQAPIGSDLFALNVQRGRELGVKSYNDLRIAYGLDPATAFTNITSISSVAAAMSIAYNGDLTGIDPYLAANAEDPLPGAVLGPLNAAIVCDQFVKLRDADPFWFEADGQFTASELESLKSTRLNDLFLRNIPNYGNLNPAPFTNQPAPSTTTTTTTTTTPSATTAAVLSTSSTTTVTATKSTTQTTTSSSSSSSSHAALGQGSSSGLLTSSELIAIIAGGVHSYNICICL